jgi:hypothetical protein
VSSNKKRRCKLYMILFYSSHEEKLTNTLQNFQNLTNLDIVTFTMML